MRLLLSIIIIIFSANTVIAADKSTGVLKVGDMVPEALGVDRHGNKISAPDHIGKIVVISFWATWCPPCRKELPIIDNLQRLAGKDNLSVIAVNFGEKRRTFRKFIKAAKLKNLTFTHDSKGRIGKKSYGVTAIPHMVIVDHTGKIAHIHIGYGEGSIDSLVTEINALLRNLPA